MEPQPMQTITNEHPPLETRLLRLLRWSRYVCLSMGVLALGYVGLAALDARMYQVDADLFLDSQIQARQEHPGSFSQPQLVPEAGVLGRITIPRLGMSIAILEGTKPPVLRLGVGHIEGTALPGEPGNTGIAGHRDTFFRDLKDIHIADEIQVRTVAGLYSYRVDRVKVVAPDDVSVLSPSGESALTLVTCYPFYLVGAAPKRFVVHALKL